MASIRAVSDGGETLWAPKGGGKPPRQATWEVVVRLGKNAEGKYPRKSRRVVGSYRDAKLAAVRLEQRYGARRAAEAPKTLSEAVERFIAKRDTIGSITERTLLGYKGLAKRIAADPIGQADLASLSSADLEAFYERLRGHGLQPNTIVHFHTLLRGTIRMCVRLEWLAPPGPEPEGPKVTPPQPQNPLPEDIREFIEAWGRDPKHRSKAAALLLAGITGCRRGEVCAWHWSDFDTENGELLVQRAISTGGEHRTKTKRDRRITVGPLAMQVVREEWDRYVEHCEVLRRTPDPDSYVFSASPDHRTALNPDALSNAFADLRERLVQEATARAEAATTEGDRVALLRKALRLRAIQFKHMRSFAASQMVAGGIDVSTSSARLGHQPEVELRHYARASNDGAAADLLEKLLAPALPAETW